MAIDYLPLGTAVAIEFLGPVAVAGVTGQGWRDRLGIALAAVGVVLLAGVQLEGGLTRDVVIGLVAILGFARRPGPATSCSAGGSRCSGTGSARWRSA